MIHGQIDGTIRHTANLTIGEGGRVNATVEAEYIAVEGRVDGDLYGTRSVTVCETAKVNGNIVSPTVSLRQGAKFNGKIDMTGTPVAAEKPMETDDAETAKQEEPANDAEAKPGKPRSAA